MQVLGEPQDYEPHELNVFLRLSESLMQRLIDWEERYCLSLGDIALQHDLASSEGEENNVGTIISPRRENQVAQSSTRMKANVDAPSLISQEAIIMHQTSLQNPLCRHYYPLLLPPDAVQPPPAQRTVQYHSKAALSYVRQPSAPDRISYLRAQGWVVLLPLGQKGLLAMATYGGGCGK